MPQETEKQEKQQPHDVVDDSVHDTEPDMEHAKQQQTEVSDQTSEAENPAHLSVTLAEATAKIRQLETELKEQKLRSLAEEQNIRRRASADVEKAHKYGQEKMFRELLPVIDSLEQALLSAKNHGEPNQKQENHQVIQSIVEGIELTLKMLLDGLTKFGIEIIDPEGQVFNPQEHEAMAMQPSDKVEPNTVLQVVQKGYKLYDRVLRPARVLVAKG